MFGKLKNILSKKEKQLTYQVSSFDYFQNELEYCYKKSGSRNNNIVNENIQLVDEPENKHDPNAIAVYLLNLQIGYIPASDTNLVRSIKRPKEIYIRLYEYNNKYRAELTISY